MSDPKFSEISAQDTHLAALEAKEWIEAVVEKKFKGDSFRESLQDGVLLCELMNKLIPDSIRRINKSRSPIAYLDNIQQFLYCCQDLGMKDAQLFDTMDLQEVKIVRKTGVKRNEDDRRIRNVCSTLYWLGRAMSETEDYVGPQLDLNLFKNLMDGNFSEEVDDNEIGVEGNSYPTTNHFQEKPRIHHHSEPPAPSNGGGGGGGGGGGLDNGLVLTFEQEQTADELLADIQNAVDEMLNDFQANPATPPQQQPPQQPPPQQQPPQQPPPPPVAPKTKKKPKREKNLVGSMGHKIRIKTKDGGFGFQVMGGIDSDIPAQVDYIVAGSAADESTLRVGDVIVSVNGRNTIKLSHSSLVSMVKKAGQAGEVVIGVTREVESVSSPDQDTTDFSDIFGSDTANTTTGVGFSRRESRERWEEENEERERQAQEIALLYPQRNSGPQPVENGLSPHHSLGKEPLPTLVEHQEEALFEEIQEMIESAPTPPVSPSPSPPPQVQTQPLYSSSPESPSFSPTRPLRDDRESLEQEIRELNHMVVVGNNPPPPSDDHRHVNDSYKQPPLGSREINSSEEEYVPPAKTVRQKDNNIAIKMDSFQIEESTSPVPLSPEISSHVEVTQIQENYTVSPEDLTPKSPVDTQFSSSSPLLSNAPPMGLTSEEALDHHINELLKFSGSSASAIIPQDIITTLPAHMATPPLDHATATPSPDQVVTPPPMFHSPPPPKPKSEAPKRVVKRPAPPPPKPKPASPPPDIEFEEKSETPVNQVPEETTATSDDIPNHFTSSIEDLEIPSSLLRSDSPDLVTQMEMLAYSKSITPMAESKPFSFQSQKSTPLQQASGPEIKLRENTSSSSLTNKVPQSYPDQQRTELQAKLGTQLPSQTHHQAQEQHPSSQFTSRNDIPLSSNNNSSGSSISTKLVHPSTPENVEIMGGVKIQRVQKTRWTPKSNSTESSPAQTTEHQQHFLTSCDRAATLPHFHNQAAMHNGSPQKTRFTSSEINKYEQASSGGGGGGGGGGNNAPIVVVRGLGSGVGIGMDPNRFSLPISSVNNPYQPRPSQQIQEQNGNGSRSVPWKSQEELRIHSTQQPKGVPQHSQRQSTAPDGMKDYRVQKTMSLSRGSTESWRNNRTGSTLKERVKDGYQVAYVTKAGNPNDLCSRCHQPLGQAIVLSIPGTKTMYHPKCFVCRVCRSQLSAGGQSTTVMMKNMQLHCRFCASNDNGTQTTEC